MVANQAVPNIDRPRFDSAAFDLALQCVMGILIPVVVWGAIVLNNILWSRLPPVCPGQPSRKHARPNLDCLVSSNSKPARC
jgi:hypothetical protein